MPIAVADMSAPAPSALLQELLASTKTTQRTTGAAKLAAFVKENGLRSLAEHDILNELARASRSKDAAPREAAMVAFEQLFRVVGPLGGSDPYFVPLLPDILDRYQDSGKSEPIKLAAERAAKQLVRLSPPELAPKVIDQLFAVIDGNAKWRSKVGALELLATFATSAKQQVAERLGAYVPRLTGAMRDTKSEIATTAEKTAITLCSVLTNPDIQPFVPVLVKCMADPSTVPEAIKRLSSTVWVREIDGPTLAVVGPLLIRGLADRGNVAQRQTVVLITNLFKLVRSPDLAAEHVPDILPGVERIYESAAFPEIRAFAGQAQQAVKAAAQGAAVPAVNHFATSVEDEKRAFEELRALVEKESGIKPDAFFDISLASVTFAIAQLVRKRAFDEKEWQTTYIPPYLKAFIPSEQADALAIELRKRWMAIDQARFQVEAPEDDDEEGEILVDLPFSLAYGGLLLLNHTVLKLRRGHIYGVCEIGRAHV